MVLGFKEHFVGRILSRVKIHTIREDIHRRWFIGRKIHFATGVRTKNYKQFAVGECVDIRVIKIDPANKTIRVNCVELNEYEKELLRINDGFDSMLDFWEWFDKPFLGRLIYFRVDTKFLTKERMMDEEVNLEFVMWLTGHDKETILQMHNDWQKSPSTGSQLKSVSRYIR